MNQINITSAQYKDDSLTGESNALIVAVIDEHMVYVPLNPANRHYAEIMRQVDAGELTIADAE